MTSKLTWLHISDIHFHPSTAWRDNIARISLLEYLDSSLKNNAISHPDLIFCTGDIAFGETGSSPLSDQYKDARVFFDKLLDTCGENGTPISKNRLFIVPGNHDVNRSYINADAQATLTKWANESESHIDEINNRFEKLSTEFTDAARRLTDYTEFVTEYIPHQIDTSGRHHYSNLIDIAGLKVGIAGFNSAWSCSGPEDDRNVWLAAEWQFNAANIALAEADLRIGLIHHPIDWCNEADRKLATRRITTDFDFWLHGHQHDTWVTADNNCVKIASGAIGANSSEEFGFNLVELDLSRLNGVIHLNSRKKGSSNWTIAPIEVTAPNGQWPIDHLPSKFAQAIKQTSVSTPTASGPHKRTPKLFGRENALATTQEELNRNALLFVYGFRGNGKTSLILELGKKFPLVGKPLVKINVLPSTKAEDIFRQIATFLGDTSEFPIPPTGNAESIAAEVKKRYPTPQPCWIWIDRAHHLFNDYFFRSPQLYNLISGLNVAIGENWHWIFESRERPPVNTFKNVKYWECEVLGLDKNNLAACLLDNAPKGKEEFWEYNGKELKGIYQWLGGGHGSQAHPQTIQFLIEVALGRNETPLQVLKRHLGDVNERIEEKLLGDLYRNVLNENEQIMLQALSLYRNSIPHDHADALEIKLDIHGSWDGLDRRCLLAVSPEQQNYFIHSFIAEWIQINSLGYSATIREEHIDLLESTEESKLKHAQKLHASIADCWLKQLGKSRRATNLNISRALEAFHHLMLSDQGERIHEIAVKLLTGNLDWAIQRTNILSKHLYKTNAPLAKRKDAFEYHAILDPEDALVQKHLGRCWEEIEGRASKRAQQHYENACRLRPDHNQNWKCLGLSLRASGREGASKFLAHMNELEQNYPNVIDDYLRAIQANCFDITDQPEKASELRIKQIYSHSKHAAFYNDEAKILLEKGKPESALKILKLAVKNGCANDFTETTRLRALYIINPAMATKMRMKKIMSGSRHPSYYTDEAMAKIDNEKPEDALKILDIAEKNGCIDDYTAAIRTKALQSISPDQASRIRMNKINNGTKNPVFYNEEATARINSNDPQGALNILALAEKRKCFNAYSKTIQRTALNKLNLQSCTSNKA